MAVLISGILLALGSAIYNIASKEVILSSTGRDSQYSFYAADTGIECALYWDAEGRDAFASTSPTTQVVCGQGAQPVPPNPGNRAATLTRTYTSPVPGSDSDTEVTTFTFSLGNALTDPCSIVTVTKRSYPTRTSIGAAGYNTCVATSPRRIERAIRLTY